VEEDSPGTRDLVVVCGDATIATSTLLLAAAFPWVREVLEEAGEESALSLPSLPSSLLATFLHSCASGPWSNDFIPVLTLLNPGCTPPYTQTKIQSETPHKNIVDSRSVLKKSFVQKFETSTNYAELQNSEIMDKKKVASDLVMDWESDGEDDGDLEETEEVSKEEEGFDMKKYDMVVSIGEEKGEKELIESLISHTTPEAEKNKVELLSEANGIVLYDSPSKIDEKPHKCKKCNNCYKTTKSFRGHIARKQCKVQSTTHTCKKCNICYKTRKSFREHVRTKHFEDKSAKPERKEEKDYIKYSPSNHIKVDYNSFICPHCEQDFNNEIFQRDPDLDITNRKRVYRVHVKYCLVEQFTCSCSSYTSPLHSPPPSSSNPLFQHHHSEVRQRYQHMVEEHQAPVYWCALPPTMAEPPSRATLPPCTFLDCLHSFPSLPALREHREEVVPRGPGRRWAKRSYICSDCGLDFTRDKKRHVKLVRHQGSCRVEQFVCACPGVPSLAPGEAKTKIRDFKIKAQHMKTVHLGQHGCMDALDCYETFETSELLQEHIKEKHQESQEIPGISFTCEECGQQFNKYTVTMYKGTGIGITKEYERHLRLHRVVNFSCDCPSVPRINKENALLERGLSKAALTKERHMQVDHMGWFGCTTCIESFEGNDALTNHESSHDKVFMCATCGEAKTSQHSLQYHIDNYHDNKPVECVTCKEVCRNETFFKRHMLHHHKPAQECDICGKSFKSIKLHKQVVHTTEKPYKCDNCDQSFNTKNNLNKHIMNVHTKTQPYTCRYGCEDKRYNDSNNRRAHERRRHGVKLDRYRQTEYLGKKLL